MSCSARRPAAAAIAAALLATLALAGCGGGAIAADTPDSSGQSFVGSAYNSSVFRAGARPVAPDISGMTLTGQHLSLSAYRGSVVVINFWGSWCAPCRAEGPTLAVLSEQYRSKGVSFLGDDVGDTTANALAFTRDIGIGYPSVNDASYSIVQDFSRVASVGYTPTTVVIDRTGHIAGLVIGKISYQSMATILNDVAASP